MVELRKRKQAVRYTVDQDPDVESEGSKATKKTKTSKASDWPIKDAKKTTTKATKGKGSTRGTKNASKKYQDTITGVQKAYKQLEKGYKINPTVFSGVTSDDVARRMAKFIPDVENLSEMKPDGTKYAYDLLIYLGEHGHADLDFAFKMCGWGDTDEEYEKMDKAMLKVIDARIEQDGNPVGSEEFEPEEDSGDEVEEYRKSLNKDRPNKRERGVIDKMRKEKFSRRVERKRERMENAKDWVSNAIPILQTKKDYLEQYGMGKNYFTQSITKLKGLKDQKEGVVKDDGTKEDKLEEEAKAKKEDKAEE